MFLRVLKNILFYLIFIPFILLILHYIWVPQYNFSEQMPFYGSKVYNPYQKKRLNDWKMLGIISSPIWYKNLSKTFQPNELNQIDSMFYDTTIIISSRLFEKGKHVNYSHGLIVNDITVLNSKSLMRRSYPYFKTLNNKQHRINLLKDSTSLVYLKPSVIFEDYNSTHPILLSNYDGYITDMNMEDATYLWDVSLSAGRYVSLIGESSFSCEDEYVKSKYTQAIYYNPKAKNIYQALKTHDFVTAVFPKSLVSKKEKPLFRLKKVGVDNRYITVSCSRQAQSIAFIGQNGVVQQFQSNSYFSIYDIKRDDSYIRVEVTFKDGVKYYLNPLIKMNRLSQNENRGVDINQLSTMLYRIFGILGLIIVIALILYVKRRTRIQFIEITVDEKTNKKIKKVKTL